jgi:vacuolar protein sorting-associated protein 26
MAKEGPLAFELALNSATQACPGVITTGEGFDFTLTITVSDGSRFAHRGVEAEFCTEFSPKNSKTVKLNQLQVHLAEPGTLSGSQAFSGPKLSTPAHMQTYHGSLFHITHWIRVAVKKTLGSVTWQQEVISYEIHPPLKKIDPLCVRVAVSENIRIDLMISRRSFELGDVICGAAHFLLVALKIRQFTVTLQAQELMEAGGKTQKGRHVLHTWDITDGAPVKGEIVPFRLYLAPLAASPSCSRAESGYTVTHFLHFSITTTSNEKYFKALQVHLHKCAQPPFIFTNEE